MKLKQLNEDIILERAEWLKFAGDIAGFIPVVGEGADLGVALLHLRDKEYLDAAFSLVSMVPQIGDAAGKSAKYLRKTLKTASKGGPKAAKYAKIAIKLVDKVVGVMTKAWPKVVQMASKIEKLEPFIRKMTAALKEFIQEINRLKQNQVKQLQS